MRLTSSCRPAIFNNVSVINAAKTEKNHCMVRGKFSLKIKLEKSCVIRSTHQFKSKTSKVFNWSFKIVSSVSGATWTSTTLGLWKLHLRLGLRSSKPAAQIDLKTPQPHFKAHGRSKRRKSLKNDLRPSNTYHIREAVERNKGSKVCVSDSSIGQSQLTKLKTDDSRAVSAKLDLLREVEKFY